MNFDPQNDFMFLIPKIKFGSALHPSMEYALTKKGERFVE